MNKDNFDKFTSELDHNIKCIHRKIVGGYLKFENKRDFDSSSLNFSLENSEFLKYNSPEQNQNEHKLNLYKDTILTPNTGKKITIGNKINNIEKLTDPITSTNEREN